MALMTRWRPSLWSQSMIICWTKQCNVCFAAFACLRPDSDASLFGLSFCASILDRCNGPEGLAVASSACFITSSTFHNCVYSRRDLSNGWKELYSSSVPVIGKACHGYTTGQDFPHCTCTCTHCIRSTTGTVLMGYGCSIPQNPQYQQYLWYFHLKNVIINISFNKKIIRI